MSGQRRRRIKRCVDAAVSTTISSDTRIRIGICNRVSISATACSVTLLLLLQDLINIARRDPSILPLRRYLLQLFELINSLVHLLLELRDLNLFRQLR